MPNRTASLFRPPEENSRLFLLLFLAVLAAFGPFVTDLYLPTLPEQAREFAAAPATVQLGLSMTMWGLAIGQLFVGPLSDVRGRRGPLLASLLVFTGATFGAAVAPTIELFLLWRFLEGLGASGAIVMSRAVAADRYTGRALGQFMAVMGAIQGVACCGIRRLARDFLAPLCDGRRTARRDGPSPCRDAARCPKEVRRGCDLR